MKIMTFNFTVSMVLVIKVIEFIFGLITGAIIEIFDHIAYKFEESSFLRKAYYWMCDHQCAVFMIVCIIADVTSVFVLSFIF